MDEAATQPAKKVKTTHEEKKMADHAGSTAEDPEPQKRNLGKPECRMIVHNIGKKHNVGNITRSAVAFGVSQIIVVGANKVNTHGHMNTKRYVKWEHYETLAEARSELRKENFRIIGVEIGETSQDVTKHPFQGNSCFIFGNEGSGLHKTAAAICDDLVYIPQYTPGTASLNVSVAASIVLHHFAVWAQYTPNTFEGQKFTVDQSKQVETFMFSSSKAHQKKIEERRLKREAASLVQQPSQALDSSAQDSRGASDSGKATPS